MVGGRSHNLRSTPEQPRILPLVLAIFTLSDVSASQEKSGMVIQITVSSQNGYTLCSVLLDTGSPVTLLSEKLQGQLNLPTMLLDSQYHLPGTIGNSLITLETAQSDIALDHKTWSTPAIVVSSLAPLLILEINFDKNDV